MPVMITGTKHMPPSAGEVPSLMHQLIEWLNREGKKMPIIETASILHHKFVHIHPFLDGNGRTGRLVMNLLLLKAGYPLVIILKNDRKKYYKALREADEGNYAPLVLLIAQSIDRSLTIYLKTLTPDRKEDRKKYMSLAEASQICRYSAKYLNLLARQGKLEAYKEGRNWVTTKESIEKYIKERERKRK